MASFKYYPLELVIPEFGSDFHIELADLDNLISPRLLNRITTNMVLFSELHNIFHTLETIQSARIEGNNTTLLQYLDIKQRDSKKPKEKLQELYNIENALNYIDDLNREQKLEITEDLIKKIHSIICFKLTPNTQGGDGDTTPGEYKTQDNQIGQSEHLPAPVEIVADLTREMIIFVNQAHPPVFNFLKIALTHHRFSWIHPFHNGNGRVARCLSYAQILKTVGSEYALVRVVNPTAIFCSNRDEYYKHLHLADSGNPEGILKWCEYFIHGVRLEAEKTYKLMNYPYLKQFILLPAVKYLRNKEKFEGKVLDVIEMIIEKQSFRSSDLADLLPNKSSVYRSRFINNLKDKKLIQSTSFSKQEYTLSFENLELQKVVIFELANKDFIARSFMDELS